MIYESNSINYADLFFGNCVIWVNLQVLRHNDYCYGVKLSSSPEQCYNWQGKLDMKISPYRHDQCICICVSVFVFVLVYLYLCICIWRLTHSRIDASPHELVWSNLVLACYQSVHCALLQKKYSFLAILCIYVFLYLLAIFCFFPSVTVFLPQI